MKKQFIYLVSLVASIAVISACQKEFEGDRQTQELPETYMVIDSIRRDSNNLLVSTVTAYWWGESKTGFITGYEVSIDGQQTWTTTTEQKGVFLLTLPSGAASGIVPVHVRAIDNLGQKDPTPAYTTFPVKNSAPRTAGEVSSSFPDTTFPVMGIGWSATDIDGIADIDRYEIVFNDTTLPLFSVPGSLRTLIVNDSNVNVNVRIECRRSGGVFTNQCDVYASNKTSPIGGTLNGITLDAKNYLYIRTVDRSGSKSPWFTDSSFIKKPVSEILLVNALYTSPAQIQDFYLNNLALPPMNITAIEAVNAVNTSFSSNELYSDVLTQSRVFTLFKKIIWLTDEPSTLTTAKLTTDAFFLNNGRMYIFAQFNDEFPLTSEALEFTPIQSMVNPVYTQGGNNYAGKFRMESGLTTSSPLSGWPVLKYNGGIGVVRPFNTFSSTGIYNYDPVMSAAMRIQTSIGAPLWTGVSTVLSRRVRAVDNQTDMIITSLPLNNMNGNNNIDSMFRKVFIDELGF